MDASSELGFESLLALVRTGAPLPWHHHRQWASLDAERLAATRALAGARHVGVQPLLRVAPVYTTPLQQEADVWTQFFRDAGFTTTAPVSARERGDASLSPSPPAEDDGDDGGSDSDGIAADEPAGATGLLGLQEGDESGDGEEDGAGALQPAAARVVGSVSEQAEPAGGALAAAKRGSLLTVALRGADTGGAAGGGDGSGDDGDSVGSDRPGALGARSVASRYAGRARGPASVASATSRRSGVSAFVAGGRATTTAGGEDVRSVAGGAESVSSAGTMVVKVYLPSRAPLRVRVAEVATVGDVIDETLRQTRLKPAGTSDGALVGDVTCYELRLHDEDGEPDDDFPPLERGRKIANFGQGGVHEYCLRVLATPMAAWRAAHADATSAAPPAAGSTPSPADTGSGKAAAAAVASHAAPSSTAANPVPTGSPPPRRPGEAGVPSGGAMPAVALPPASAATTAPQPSLRVVLPGHPTPTVTMVPITPGMRVQEALEFVARRHRLPVFHERFVLRVSPMEMVRLGLTSRELPPQALLDRLPVDSVECVRKTFADAPVVPTPTRSSMTEGGGGGGAGGDGAPVTPGAIAAARRSLAGGAGAGGGDGGDGDGGGGGAGADGDGAGGGGGGDTLARPLVAPGMGPAGFMHNAITAAQFQEWHVVKINKRGRPQERLMGIDLTRITNRKVEKRRFVSEKTVNAERLISDIVVVEVSESVRNRFSITYREPDSPDVCLSYDTRTPWEREEIVSKLAYILRLNGDSRKVVAGP